MPKLRFIEKHHQYQIDYYRHGKRVRCFLGSDKQHATKELKRVDALIKAEKLGILIATAPSQAGAIKPQNTAESNPYAPLPVNTGKGRMAITKAADLYLQRCLEAVQSGNITMKTCEARQSLLKGRFAKFLRQKYPAVEYLDELQKTHIESYRAFRLNSRNKSSPGRKIKPNSFNTDLRNLITFFNYCIENENIFSLARNPASKVGRAKKADQNERPPCLSPDQIQKVLETCKDDIEFRNVIEVFLETGLRFNELRHLNWADIDLVKNMITVKSTEEFLTKTRRSRNIPLSQRMKELLQEIPRRNERLFDLNNVQRAKAKRDNLCNIRKRFDKIKKKLPFLRLGERFHIFRHTALTRWANSGIPLPVVQKWAGHSSVEMTMKYIHPSDEESIRWMKQFSQFKQEKA